MSRSNNSTASMDERCEVAVVVNHLSIALTTFGAIGLIASTCVVLVIVGYKKELVSLRERVLLGLFLWNWMYSVTNIVPRYYSHANADDPDTCLTTFVATEQASFMSAVWIGSKYTILAYELFVIIISIHGLRVGGTSIGRRTEICAHVFCVLIFVVAHQGYAGPLYEALATMKACEQTCNGSQMCFNNCQINVHDKTLSINSTMMQVWVAILGITVLLWIYFRVIVSDLRRQWKQTATMREEQWAKEYWAPESRGQLEHKRRVLQLQQEYYIEIAAPLEKYIIVFLVFGVPALEMALNDKLIVTVSCEVLLSLRTLASAVVYFLDKSNLRELLQFRTLLWKLGYRLSWWGTLCCGNHVSRSRVKFGKTEVRLIEPNDNEEDAEAGDNDDLHHDHDNDHSQEYCESPQSTTHADTTLPTSTSKSTSTSTSSSTSTSIPTSTSTSTPLPTTTTTTTTSTTTSARTRGRTGSVNNDSVGDEQQLMSPYVSFED